jgi:predicted tellurium resistance membrane protein TerC
MSHLIVLLQDPNAWAALLTLTAMEVVLGVDNLVFIAILTSRLPADRQAIARRIGIGLALMFTITWIMHLTVPLFTVFDQPISWRDLILIFGGLFLVYKGTAEIHHRMEDAEEKGATGGAAGFGATIMQIVMIDVIFSLDSVITAVGMASDIAIMVIAVVISVIVMMVAATPLTDFVSRHPTVKMLALSFLLLIGMTLMADGFGVHVPKGYIYAAMAFSALVESLNLLAASRRRRG